MDIDRFERNAIHAGGAAGGAYLDEIGVTDMAQLSQKQWQTFIGFVVEGYCERLRLESEGALTPTETPADAKAESLPNDGLEFII